MKEDIKKIMALVFRTSLEHISDDVTQPQCVGWDSLGHINLVIALEKRFDVSFEPEEIAEMMSLKKIVETVIKKKG